MGNGAGEERIAGGDGVDEGLEEIDDGPGVERGPGDDVVFAREASLRELDNGFPSGCCNCNQPRTESKEEVAGSVGQGEWTGIVIDSGFDLLLVEIQSGEWRNVKVPFQRTAGKQGWARRCGYTEERRAKRQLSMRARKLNRVDRGEATDDGDVQQNGGRPCGASP